MFLPIFIKKNLKRQSYEDFNVCNTENELFNYIFKDFASSIDFFQICVGPEKDRFLWTYYYTVMKANIRYVFLLLETEQKLGLTSAFICQQSETIFFHR